MNRIKKRNNGQVLLLVLITMMVLAIILTSVTTNQVKDTQNTQSTNKFEVMNSYAEKMSFQLGLQFANPTKNNFNISVFAEEATPESVTDSIETLLSQMGWKTREQCEKQDACYKCNVEFNTAITNQYTSDTTDAKTANPENLKAVAKICDATDIQNAELFKDEILIFNLKGIEKNTVQSKTFQVAWEPNERLKDIAIELSVDFIYSTEGRRNYGTIKSVYKPATATIFTSSINEQNAKYITFTNTATDSFQFKLDQFENLLKNNNGYFKHFHNSDFELISYEQLRIRPVIKSNDLVSMDISVKTVEQPGLEIVQGRSIEVVVYEQTPQAEADTAGAFRGSQASIISTVPAAKISGLFDYILKNDKTIIP